MNPEALALRVYISACLSVLHLAHVVLPLNGKTQNAFYLRLESMKRYKNFNGEKLIYCKHSAGECDFTASASVSEYL